MNKGNRLEREAKTFTAMVRLYCRKNHGPAARLCDECGEVLVYALSRLQNCPFGKAKTTCLNCPIHCYQPEMRERVKEIMRYSGPLMLLYHPALAVEHLLDGLRDKLRRK